MTVIRTKAQYEGHLEELEELLRSGELGNATVEALRLDELARAIEDYEKERFPFQVPSPVEAVEFRLQQMGLTRRHLEPLLGGRSKVSEVLSGKRTLTVRMIRALNHGLGIPADLLLQDTQIANLSIEELDWSKFPVKEMVRRQWLATSEHDAVEATKTFVEAVIPAEYAPALFRRSSSIAKGAIDYYSLLAWMARVIHLAETEPVSKPFDKGLDQAALFSEMAILSSNENGPFLAKSWLANVGVRLVVEPHLPKTRLDGAALLDSAGNPIIALTVRYDRLDSFWFTLLHELAHVFRHLNQEDMVIVDDLDLDRSQDFSEIEADSVARNALIPRQLWARSDAYRVRTKRTILALADRLKIHPSIVAGRLRFETDNYQRFGELLGSGEVRKHFPEVKW